MADLSLLFGAIGMVVGTAAILMMFLNSEKVVPSLKQMNEQMSLSLLAMLVGMSALLIDTIFSLGLWAEGVAATAFLVAVGFLIHIVRAAKGGGS